MKVAVNPLVLAAALGLLGPAALAEDETDLDHGVVGIWTRSAGGVTSAADLGKTFELIPVEDQLLLDNGTGSETAWSRLDDSQAVQEIVLDGALIQRTLTVDGDALALEARITRNGITDVLHSTYLRDA